MMPCPRCGNEWQIAGPHGGECSKCGSITREEIDQPREPKDSAPETHQTSSRGRASQASKLVKLAEDLELFHAPDGQTFASIQVAGHRETWTLRTAHFKDLLARRFYEKERAAPNAQAIQEALSVLAGEARFGGPELPVNVRMAESEGSLFVDLGNDSWEVVEISSDGWRVVSNAPVRFRRTKGMVPLPQPLTGGSLSDVEQLINVGGSKDVVLYISALVGAMRCQGPYPVLVLQGEPGSAKSTAARVNRGLIDPSVPSLRAPPRNEHELVIAASNSRSVAFDNLSSLPRWLSDAICRLATGGGLGARQLYTDAEEALFDVQRPVIINGITELATSGDLMDRALVLTLPEIPDYRRKSEKAFWAEFERVRPYLLGALYDAVAMALAKEATTQLGALPRMADFAIWVVAAEPALPWKPGEFMAAYESNRDDANLATLEASPVSQPVRDLAERRDWQGTATELLTELDSTVADGTRRLKSWPKSGRSLSNALRRIVPNLRALEIEVTFDRQGNRRTINIRKSPQSSSLPSSASLEAASDSEAMTQPAFPMTQHAAGELASVTPTQVRNDVSDANDDEIQALSETSVWEPE